MISREHKLSVARHAKLLGFSRGRLCYSPRPVSDGDLALMRRIVTGIAAMALGVSFAEAIRRIVFAIFGKV